MTRTVRRLLLASFGFTIWTVAAQAGWNNVGQVACCDGPIRRAVNKPAEPAPSRTSNYETRYETTTQFEPITVRKPEKYLEEVPVKVRSYYEVPVETYSYRSYYDPCSGKCQQVAEPRISYVKKEECKTETRFLERTRMIEVPMMREVTETRPITTYYGPVQKKYGPPVAVASGPTIDQYRQNPRIERESNPGPDKISPQALPTTPTPMRMPGEVKNPTRSSDYRYNALSTSAAKESGAKVFGDVLKGDRQTPVSNAKVVFVNTADQTDRVYLTADSFGGFDVKLTAGDWLVYAGPGTGKADYISKFSVKDGDRQELGVVTK
jgi:hypothetical protein